MADKDYYCTGIDAPFTTASEYLNEGDTSNAAQSLAHAVTRLIRKAVAAGHCPLEAYTAQLARLAASQGEAREQFICAPLPPAPGKIAELARRAMLDIATDIQFLGVVPDDLAQTLLRRTCEEVQEWGLLTRLEVNARLGVAGESPSVRRDLAAVRALTTQTYVQVVHDATSDPQHRGFRVAQVAKPATETGNPIPGFRTPDRGTGG